MIETNGIHIHDCDFNEYKAEKVVNQITRRAQCSTPTVVNANGISKKFDDYAIQLAMPKKDNLLQAVSQKRQKEECFQIPAPVD